MALRLKAEEIKQLVLDDDLWQRANIVIKMGKSICDVLNLSNSDGLTAGKIYDKHFQVRVDMVLFQLAGLMQFYLSNSPLQKKSSLAQSILGEALRARRQPRLRRGLLTVANPPGLACGASHE